MPPTVCRSMRHARATAYMVQWTAIHATQSSKGLVKRDLGRAHGTASTTACVRARAKRSILFIAWRLSRRLCLATQS